MIFVGAQRIYTRAILVNKKYVCRIFFVGGTWGGGAPSICVGGGGHVARAPPPPGPPVATPLPQYQKAG